MESGPPGLPQAPWDEEVRFAHDLESNSACDRASHLALKIEGALPPEFSVHLRQVLSALPEVTLCCKHRRRHLTGLSRRFIESQGESDYTGSPKTYTPRAGSVHLEHGDLPTAQVAPTRYQHTLLSLTCPQCCGNNRRDGVRINLLNQNPMLSGPCTFATIPTPCSLASSWTTTQDSLPPLDFSASTPEARVSRLASRNHSVPWRCNLTESQNHTYPTEAL